MVIEPNHIKYKTGSGAQVTDTSTKAHLHKSSISLTAYNGKNIPVKGHCTLNVQHHGKSVPLLLVVDKTQSLAIIELSSNKKLNLIFRAMFVIQNPRRNVLEQYTECFEEKVALPNTHHNTVFI